MRPQNWLCSLQVSVPGQNGIAMSLSCVDQCLLGLRDQCFNTVYTVAKPKSKRCRYLVVSASAGMQLFAGVADQLD